MTTSIASGARGAGVTMTGQLIAMGIQFVGTIVLSRLLTPSDFGLVAMAAVFIAVGGLIRDFGMPTAALGARTLSNQQASNILWVSLSLSAFAGLLLLVSTPAIAHFYGEPRLTSILPVLAGVLVVNGVQAQYQVQLARAMRFTAVVVILSLARIIALGSAVLAAAGGWGYWALVIQQAVLALASLVGSGLITRWLPARPRQGSDSMKLVRAGGNLGVANVLGFLADNADSFMIGAVWGASPLGLYNRAFSLFMVPISSVFGPLTGVVIPVVNRAVSEGRSASGVLLRIQSIICGLSIWVLVATAVTSPWLIPPLLGAQWTETVPLLQILAIGGAFKALSQTNYWVYLVEQQTRNLLTSNLVTKPVQIIFVVGAAFISVEAVAWAYAIGRAWTWPFNLYWLSRTTDGYTWPYAANGSRLLAASGAAYALTSWLMTQVDLGSQLAMSAFGVVLSSVIYFGTVSILPGGRVELHRALVLGRTVFRQ